MNTIPFQIGMYAYLLMFDRWANYNEATRRYAGRWETMTDTLYVVRETWGQYVKVERISKYANDVQCRWYNMKKFVPVSPEQMPVAMAKLQQCMASQMRQLETDMRFKLEQAKREAMQPARELSANTVTRALVHANDNGYCQETVVALVSAGHKMPKIQLVMEVTVQVPIELDGKRDYLAVRSIFGQTRGDISKLQGERTTEEVILNRVRKALNAGEIELEYSYYDSNSFPIVKDASVEFGDPVIRPLDEVQSESPAYPGDESNWDEDNDDY